MSKSLRLAAVACMLMAAPVLAQMPPDAPVSVPTAPADTPETTEVKTAAKEFMTALADKDTTNMKKLFAGTDEDYKLAEVMHDMFLAGMKLQSAAEAKWPEEMKKERKSDDFDPKKMAERIDKERVTITGDTAKLSSGTLLKKTNGKWQVTDVIGDPMGKGMVSGMFGAITPLINEAAAEIESGKYASFAEAKAAIQQKMQANMQKKMMGPGGPGGPSTMPSR